MQKNNSLSLLFYLFFAHHTVSLSTGASCLYSTLEEDRIVGGRTTNRSIWPSMLNLQTAKRGLFCGANFLGNFKGKDGITRSWVLTAAHCLDPMLNNITVSTFHPDSNEHQKLPASIVWKSQILRKHIHPKYDVVSSSFDFGLLELTKTLSMRTGFLEPVRLISAKFSIDGVQNLKGIAVGWGVTHENEQMSSQMLRQVVLPIFDNSGCKASYSAIQDFIITQDMICAGLKGLDACNGDSGGPLFISRVLSTGRVYLLTGISSFGIGCGRPGLPGLYGFVRFARPWIDKTLKG